MNNNESPIVGTFCVSSLAHWAKLILDFKDFSEDGCTFALGLSYNFIHTSCTLDKAYGCVVDTNLNF